MDYDTMTKEITNVARATCSLIFKIFKNCILKFHNNLKLILYVENVVFYQHANFQLEIPSIWGCAKITKSNISIVANSANFQSLKICKILSFLCSPKYTYYELKFGTLVEQTIIYIYFFQFSFETSKCWFRILEKNELHVAHPTKSHTHYDNILFLRHANFNII
jgi:hypothetical protein